MCAQKSKTINVIDLIPNPVLLPDEGQAEYDKLHTALMNELRPGTAYEAILADGLVRVEWEIFRHRRLRDDLTVSSCAMATAELLDGGPKSGGPSRESLQYGQALARNEGLPFARALEAISSRGYNFEDLIAAGYQKSLPTIQVHDNRLAELMKRRKNLRDEYAQLQDLRRRSANDATADGE